MVFSDPPYNVPIAGHVGGLGKVQHREFAMASGEMSDAEFTGFLSSVFAQLASYSVDGAIHFQCIDWRHIGEMLAAGKASYSKLKNICVWSKVNAGMGSFYRSQHEFVCVFKSGNAAHINNIELGKFCGLPDGAPHRTSWFGLPRSHWLFSSDPSLARRGSDRNCRAGQLR